jgi:hypothetical protein
MGTLVMAFDRKSFKDKLQFTLAAAITHFYMTQLAERNGQTKWVRHWHSEVDRLINMDTVFVLVSNIKGKWDKRKALSEALADVRASDGGYRRAAVNYVVKVYKLKKVDRQLPAGIEEEFYRMVQEAAESALSAPADAEDAEFQ